MQIIEGIIFLLTLVGFVFLIKYKSIKKQYMIVLIGITLLLFLIHIIFESTRWQLYPLYVALFLCILMAIFFIFKFHEFQNKRILRIVAMILIGFLFIVSVVTSLILPVYEIPQPSGEFSIGTSSFILTDSDREELYGEEGNRRIKIQVWYPAESTDGFDLVPWLEDGKVVSQALVTDMGLPEFMLNHTELIMSNSYRDAPISDDFDEYPIVVISHGWTGFRNVHTDLAEELASLGYIVVGIEHTYGSIATVFSEDDIAYLNRDALPDRDATSDFLGYANTLVNTYAGDIDLTLDELEKMNSGDVLSMFEGRLDLTSIGLLGHSTGAGADVAVAINDSRIKAILGMDAWVEPIYEEEIEKGLDIPALFLRSGAWETGVNNINLYRLVEDNSDDSWLYQIDGTVHADFSMAYMYSPLTKYINITGKLDKEYLVTILKTVITNFFDTNLKGDGSSDLNKIDELWEDVKKIQ